jgi:hypothetical protein
MGGWAGRFMKSPKSYSHMPTASIMPTRFELLESPYGRKLNYGDVEIQRDIERSYAAELFKSTMINHLRILKNLRIGTGTTDAGTDEPDFVWDKLDPRLGRQPATPRPFAHKFDRMRYVLILNFSVLCNLLVASSCYCH